MLAFLKAAKLKDRATVESQRKLTMAFGAIGMDFMQLHPVIHGALLNEAIATSSEAAMEVYLKAVEALLDAPGTDEMKAQVLLEIYTDRANKFKP
jgi:hypothetical protein